MTDRQRAEFRWREAAKAEREYSLGVEAENEQLRSEIATLKLERDYLRPALDQAKLSSELLHGELHRLRANDKSPAAEVRPPT